jgi:hypothetical protein
MVWAIPLLINYILIGGNSDHIPYYKKNYIKTHPLRKVGKVNKPLYNENDPRLFQVFYHLIEHRTDMLCAGVG